MNESPSISSLSREYTSEAELGDSARRSKVDEGPQVRYKLERQGSVQIKRGVSSMFVSKGLS